MKFNRELAVFFLCSSLVVPDAHGQSCTSQGVCQAHFDDCKALNNVDKVISDLTSTKNDFLVLPGDISVIDLMLGSNEQHDPAVSFVPPTVIPANATGEFTLDAIGEKSGVEACENLDFLGGQVLGMGFSALDREICGAFNPCSHTYAIAQVNVLPKVKFYKVLSVALTALGYSLKGELEVTTGNDMWAGGDTLQPLTKNGHIVVKGEGALELDISSKIEAAITIESTLLVNADPNSNGLVNPFKIDEATELDFFFLLTGSATAVFKLKNKKGEETEIDFGKFSDAKVDLYTHVEGTESQIQLAHSIGINLQIICDEIEWMSILCDFFDGESHIAGAVRAYAAFKEFGVMFQVRGSLGLNSDFIEDLINWPDGGATFDATLSMEFEDGAVKVCAKASGAGKKCFSSCSNSSDCSENKFCNLGVCIKKRKVGGACLRDVACLSGDCGDLGFCNGCPKAGKDDFCEELHPGKNLYCKWSGSNNHCVERKNIGQSCSKDLVCKSGICRNSRCGECPSSGSIIGCAKGKFCKSDTLDLFTNKCENQKDIGQSCSKDLVCKSGICKTSRCGECPSSGSTIGCARGKFCKSDTLDLFTNKCENQKDIGQTCGSDVACKSGNCSKLGRCNECPKAGETGGCSSGKYCKWSSTYNKCVGRKMTGQSCGSRAACASSNCSKSGRCNECPSAGSRTGCPNGKYCKWSGTNNKCVDLKKYGETCAKNAVCKSGKCKKIGICSKR